MKTSFYPHFSLWITCSCNTT